MARDFDSCASYSTFRFIRHAYRIPSSQPLAWCIIRELPDGQAQPEWRLGVMLKGTRLYVDVAMRRFFSQVECGVISRRCYAATRRSEGEWYLYESPEAPPLRKPKSFVRDCHHSALFRPGLPDSLLL